MIINKILSAIREIHTTLKRAVIRLFPLDIVNLTELRKR